jgi:hypothetical protein
MITALITGAGDARDLHATLAGLAPAAMDALVGEVIVTGDLSDAARAVAEDAGVAIVDARFADACDSARQPWLLIIPAGVRLQVGWESAADVHMRRHDGLAGWFQPARAEAGPAARIAEALAGLRSRIMGRPAAEQGLLISRRLLTALGPASGSSHAGLIKGLGGRRLRGLPARALVERTPLQTSV